MLLISIVSEENRRIYKGVFNWAIISLQSFQGSYKQDTRRDKYQEKNFKTACLSLTDFQPTIHTGKFQIIFWASVVCTFVKRFDRNGSGRFLARIFYACLCWRIGLWLQLKTFYKKLRALLNSVQNTFTQQIKCLISKFRILARFTVNKICPYIIRKVLLYKLLRDLDAFRKCYGWGKYIAVSLAFK